MLDGVQCSKHGMLKVARLSDLLHRLFEEEQGVEEVILGLLAELPLYYPQRHTKQSITIKNVAQKVPNQLDEPD